MVPRLSHRTNPSSTAATLDPARIWPLFARASGLLAATAGAVALGLGLRWPRLSAGSYSWQNQVDHAVRLRLLQVVVAAALAAAVVGTLWFLRHRRAVDAADRLFWFARRASPLGPLSWLPWFCQWQLWQGHDLVHLLLVLLEVTALGACVAAAARAGWSAGELRLWARGHTSRWLRATAGLVSEIGQRRIFWLGVVALAASAYALWFSYHTVVWHRSVRSGYDLAIEDNILWNLLHGGPFFKAAPTLGPHGSHFGRHATLISYLLLPFYALHQSAETLLVLQSCLIAAAALPLFAFAERRLGGPSAALVALIYLMHPALQQANLFEVHYLKFGLPFFWLGLWLLDAGKTGAALLAALLTLTVREDVATWVPLLGLWAIFAGRAPRLGLALVLLGGIYVGAVKFTIMPALLRGHDDLLFMYQGLLPAGRTSFAWVLATVLGNPAFTLGALLAPSKLTFLLQILVPLACLPLRRAVGWWALIPGGIYCLLGTQYDALTDIHFQYSVHLLAFLFPALVLGLECEGGKIPPSRRPHLVALVAATLCCSYQYGAVLQEHTSRGGPLAYKFGWDEDGQQRQRAMQALQKLIPADARVAASAFTVPQISNRANGYSLSLDLYDADWIVAPTTRGEFIPAELERTSAALSSNQFGVVAIAPPFFLAHRAHPTARNAELLGRLGVSSRDP